MEPGFAEVTVPKWFFVYNHLHTVHAIASCNAAEIAMGMLMEATVPTSHRWIPKAMNVQYLEKATTSLRAQARLDPPDFAAITDGVEVVVPGQRRRQGRHRGGARRHHLLGDTGHYSLETAFHRRVRVDLCGRRISTRRTIQVRAVAFAHQAIAVERQHLVDQFAPVVAVVDHQRRLAPIYPDDVEVKVGHDSSTPSSSSRRNASFPRTTPSTLGQHARGHR